MLKATHGGVPDIVFGQGALVHLVVKIEGRRLGDADEAKFALLLFAQHRRIDHIASMLVDVRRDGMELEHVEIIGLELAQRIVDARHDVFRRKKLPGRVIGGTGLGSNDQAIARQRFDRSADHRLGAIGSSRVDDIDPKIDGEVDKRDDFSFRFALSQPEPAEPATAEPGCTDLEPGPAECPINHRKLYRLPRDARIQDCRPPAVGGRKRAPHGVVQFADFFHALAVKSEMAA
jgi:hypothetical protein